MRTLPLFLLLAFASMSCSLAALHLWDRRQVSSDLLRAGIPSLNALPDNDDAAHLGVNTGGTQTNFGDETTTVLGATVAKGLYNGVVEAQPFAHSTSGYVGLTLSATGAFTGSLKFSGKSVGFVGKMDGAGSATVRLARGAGTLTLQRDGAAGSEQINGTIITPATAAPVAFTLDRGVVVAHGSKAPQFGKYSLLMPAAAPLEAPHGDGFATVNVVASGKVRAVVTLADGTRFSQGTAISQTGVWPLYGALYHGKGSIVGSVQFRNVPQVSDLDGTLDWFRPMDANPKTQLFKNGFTAQLSVIGSSYRAPPKGTRALDFEPVDNNGRVAIGSGGLDLLLNPVTLRADNKVIVSTPGADKLKLTLAPATGLFKGSFSDAGNNKSRRFNGALFQKQALGSGFFLGLDQSGFVTLERSDDAPVAIPDTAETSEGAAVTIDVGANDADPDGERLTVFGFTQPTHGSVTFTGKIATYTPEVGYVGDDSFTYTINDGRGGTNTGTVSVVINPSGVPDPATVAPPVDPTVVTSFGSATAFLYSGPNPVQSGVAPGTIGALQACVLRGKVLKRDGTALAGVMITVLDHPEFGLTLTRADGMFDLAVNGGGKLTVKYDKLGFCPVERHVDAPWQDFAAVSDVVLVAMDPLVTPVSVGADAPMQVAAGTRQSDASGDRHATLIFAPGTTASLVMRDGSMQPASALHVRATEFTVGPNGLAAMPAELPPTSAYTYCVDLSADEEVAAGANGVQFNQTVYLYVENFLHFPVGGIVPQGDYDHAKGIWVPAENGRVVKVVSITNGAADLDTDGDGVADDGAASGVTDAERTQLAALYVAGETLWRVPVIHFSPHDCNWPPGLPGDAVPPAEPPPIHGGSDDPCNTPGSIIDIQNQILGEELNIVGASARLHYSSGRVPGRLDQLSIPLSGGSLPPSVKRIDLQIDVGGRSVKKSFPAAPSQKFDFVWDGADAYGRQLSGGQPIQIRIGYAYNVSYAIPPAGTRSFSEVSSAPGVSFVQDSARVEFVVSRTIRDVVGAVDSRSAGLGGWRLDIHHSYDPNRHTLYLGNGRQRSAESVSDVIHTAAGTGTQGDSPSGVPATAKTLTFPSSVVFAPDGSYYFADANGSYHVDAEGICLGITHGHQIYEVALAPDGTLYFGTYVSGHFEILRRENFGLFIPVAGGGSDSGVIGDGGAATAASLYFVSAITFGPDGALYLTDGNNQRIRKVRSDGIIVTVAGSGEKDSTFQVPAGYSGDGGPATQAQLSDPGGLAFSPDGSLYIADTGNNRIRRVRPDGIIETIAGNGSGAGGGFSGDGGPALDAALFRPLGIAFAPDGSLYVSDSQNNRVRRIATTGIISTIVGNGASATEFRDGGPPADSFLNEPSGIAVAPDGSFIVAETRGNRLRRVAKALPGFGTAQAVIPAQDGSEAYVFDAQGRHLRTIEGLTGALRFQFAYDAKGLLANVTDADGNTTTIEHDGSGNPLALVAPGGQRTTFTTDANGYLSSITNPAGETVHCTYSRDGSMKTLTDPKGQTHAFAYDAKGFLIRDDNPAGGTKTLVRTETADGFDVVVTSSDGVVTHETSYPTVGGSRRAMVDPRGGRHEVLIKTDGSQTATYPDGTRVTLQRQPDIRFGTQVMVLKSITTTTAGGSVSTATSTQTVALANLSDPFSVQTYSTTLTLNGQTTTTSYDATAHTISTTTPAGRQSVMTLDSHARVVDLLPDPTMDAVTFAYDAMGRPTRTQQGAQFWSYGYDARNRVTSRTNALGALTLYDYDNADRLAQVTSPAGRVFKIAHDANGNRTQITMPSTAAHGFGYNAIDLPTSYTPPGNASLLRSYDTDDTIAQTTLPGGRAIAQSYDAERIASLTFPEATATFNYADATGRATGISRTPVGGAAAQQLAISYDAGLPVSLAWTGPAEGAYTLQYDANTLLTSLDFSSGVDSTSTPFVRDPDGLPTSYGPFTITRSGPGGAASQVADAKLISRFFYDGSGRGIQRTDTVNGAPNYKIDLNYDNAGRISQKIETVAAAASTFLYEYDADSQLTKVTRDGTVVEQYGYDADGNRTSEQLGAGAAVPSNYDTQDRLTAHGATPYQFNSDGFLTQRGSDTFNYSARGELLSATITGATVDYAYDGMGRRTARTDASGTSQYFYGDPSSALQITAARSAVGVLTTFYYSDSGLLFAFERAGARYYVSCDQVGSPRIVSDATGAVLKMIEYDSFGRLTLDTNPAFDLVIGFAGGLHDEASGLLHFGFRDYDPAAGRWTARDPALFGGRQANMYAYVRNNPVNARDVSGLALCVGFSAYSGVGAGLQICIGSDGVSTCEEVGFGVGGGLDIGVEDLAKPASDIGLDLSAGCGPASFGYNATLDHCGDFKHGAKGKIGVGPFSASLDSDGKFSFGEKAKGDGWSAGIDSSGKVSGELEVSGPEDLKGFSGKCKLSGKLAGKVCQQF